MKINKFRPERMTEESSFARLTTSPAYFKILTKAAWMKSEHFTTWKLRALKLVAKCLMKHLLGTVFPIQWSSIPCRDRRRAASSWCQADTPASQRAWTGQAAPVSLKRCRCYCPKDSYSQDAWVCLSRQCPVVFPALSDVWSELQACSKRESRFVLWLWSDATKMLKLHRHCEKSTSTTNSRITNTILYVLTEAVTLQTTSMILEAGWL